MKWRWLLAVAVAGPWAWGQSAAERRMAQSFGEGDQQVQVSADKVGYEWTGEWLTLEGNVTVRSGVKEMHAEKVRYNLKTRVAEAEGRVVVRDPDGSEMSGESLSINMLERMAEVSEVEGFHAPFRVRARHGGMSNSVYVAEGVSFTTCTNAPGHEHYVVEANRIQLRADKDLKAWGAVPYVFGAPVFYLPYFYRSMGEQYGLRFEPGYRSKWGPYLLSSHRLPLYEDMAGRAVMLRTSLDARTLRGFAVGERLELYGKEYGEGSVGVYGLRDTYNRIDPRVESRDRYRVKLQYHVALSERDRIDVQGYGMSDPLVMYDFFEREYEKMPQPENVAAYTHTGDDFLGGLAMRPRLNTFYAQTAQMPEAWVNVNRQEVLGTGLYYESQNTAGYYRKTFGDRAWTNALNMTMFEPYEAGRADTAHQMTYPLRVAEFVSLVPRAAYRATFYSASRDAEERTGGGVRSVYETGASASFKLSSAWAGSDGTPWRHVMEPYADYTYRRVVHYEPERLYAFDATDGLDDANQTSLGVRHAWQYREDGRTRDIARLDVNTVMLMNPDAGERYFPRHRYLAEYRPFRTLRMRSDGEYNTAAKSWDSVTYSLWSAYRRYRLTTDFSHLSTRRTGFDRDSNHIAVSWTMPLTAAWDINAFHRYEISQRHTQEIGGYLQRNLDCIAMRLTASVLPSYRDVTARRQNADYRVGFTMWLTHFPPFGD
ncbi:MAG: LPS export ABC transporter periplasmic protein LptC [Kiritimatiellaeota bacterium]|nr:LPS export ABC transporter periplasmic protein LptC [Kiritimatiellota bacterium]